MSDSRMLRPIGSFVAAALASALIGCSMHPLPENVSRASTYDIVERVRCEVWEALHEFRRDDTHAQRIINLTAIGFDFVFDMTEGNDIKAGDKPGANLTLDRRSFKDAEKGFSLDLSATTERERKNTRRFRIVEGLRELSDSKADCSNATTRANLLYPVTGSTGMGEVVSTYIRLEKLTDVTRAGEITLPDGGGSFSIEDKSIAFSDVLKFTTNLSAGVNPKLILSTVAGDLRMTNASFFGSARRNDIHTVIVALASDPGVNLDEPPPPAGKPPFSGTQLPRRQVAQQRQAQLRMKRDRDAAARVVRDSRTATALVQKNQKARDRVLIELQRLRDLEDDDREAPRRLGERLLQLLREPD